MTRRRTQVEQARRPKNAKAALKQFNALIAGHWCTSCGMPCEYEDAGTCVVCSMASDREMHVARSADFRHRRFEDDQ